MGETLASLPFSLRNEVGKNERENILEKEKKRYLSSFIHAYLWISHLLFSSRNLI